MASLCEALDISYVMKREKKWPASWAGLCPKVPSGRPHRCGSGGAAHRSTISLWMGLLQACMDDKARGPYWAKALSPIGLEPIIAKANRF